MKSIILFLLAFLFFGLNAQSPVREVTLLEKDWSFIRRDVANGEAPLLKLTGWEEVRVPHDWAITEEFDLNIDVQTIRVIEDGERKAKLRTGRTGALPWIGVGWYRKVLPVDASDFGKRLFIEFDGAMSNAKVYLNGVFIGEWPYGYTSFSFEITDQINYEGDNILAVRLENRPESSRWYPGAGLYRNVRLVKTAPVRIAHWGTYITTPEITTKKAVLSIETEVDLLLDTPAELKLITEIFNPDGEKAGSVTSIRKSHEDLTFSQTVHIKKPQLWDIVNPLRYHAKSSLYQEGRLIDTYSTEFGIRSMTFDKDHGFFLNGEHVKLQGVCLHHDLGPLGAAVNHRATERQLELIKEMGSNSIRTAHNPSSPELLRICDSLGLLVIVEAFDEWKRAKNINGYGIHFEQWAEKDLTAMIRRDRNHPSVMMWSIGNEIREQARPDGFEVAQYLNDICHRIDPTRPVTAGFNDHVRAIKNGLADVVDVVGFNYKPYDYVNQHKEHPDRIIYGSETASTVSSRGVYKFPAVETSGAWHHDYQASSYDLDYPGRTTTPDTEFEQQDDCDFILGEYVWTGFDYLGEPTPYNPGTPARSSYFGIVDLAGLKKDRFYLYQSKWSDEPVLHLLPHWNWQDRLGQNVPVFCYTNYPKAELFVNGVSAGIRQKDTSEKYARYRMMWNDVVYEPGELKVVAYNENDEVQAEQIIKTAGTPYSMKLSADREEIRSGGHDLSFVTIEIVDKDGNLCPRADNLLFFNVSGAGKLKAVCNGSPIDHSSFSSNYMRAFSGKIVAIIESGEEPGEIALKVTGGLLRAETLIIQSF